MSPQAIVLRRVRPLGTYVLGLRQPVVVAYLSVNAAAEDGLAGRLHSALAAHLPLSPLVPTAPKTPTTQLQPSAPLLPTLGLLVAALQEAGGLPVLEQARRLSPPAAQVSVLALPTLSPQAATAALQWLVPLAGALLAAPMQRSLLPAQVASLQALLRQLSALAPSGQNNRHFIRAAYQLGIPCSALPGGVWQFGWGRRARLLRSTISDATPAIGTGWAKDKIATSALLRLAGLPVPEHFLARSADEARKIASRLGWPVVVKPANLDQGMGVEAGLQTLEDVQRAYERAAKLSQKTLVEKHVAGKDYRLLVFQGELVWANERIPAGVTGDGVASMASLIDTANQDPRRGPQSWQQMSPITLNDEAHELLAAAGLSPASVPAPGVFVALRRAANVSSGGTPVGCFERVHPDNARLAEQAAKVLRLDVAGIDLLVPDIAVSWRVSGGGICEVNAQPQLSLTSPHLYGQMLRRWVEGDGRVPSCLVLAAPDSDLAQRVTARLQAGGLAASLAATASALAGCWLDPACGALVLASDAEALQRSGLPADRFDVLVTDAATLSAGQGEALLSFLKPHVSALVVVGDSSQANDEINEAVNTLCRRYFGNKALHLVTSDEALLAIVAELMRASDKTHAGMT